MTRTLLILLLTCAAFGQNDPNRKDSIPAFNGRNSDGWVAKITGYPLGDLGRPSNEVRPVGLLKLLSRRRRPPRRCLYGRDGRVQRSIVVSGRETTAAFAFTHVGAKRGGEWRVIASQVSAPRT